MKPNFKFISIKVPADVASRLASLAKAVARPKSFLVAEAIEEYLALHEWQVQAIQAGLAEIEQGAVDDLTEIKRNWREPFAD